MTRRPKVVAFAETRLGRLTGVANEAVSVAAKMASQLGGDAGALALTSDAAGLRVRTLAEFGARSVSVASHSAFATYAPEEWTETTVAELKRLDPEAVILSATALGKDLAPRVAATLDVPLVGDVTRIELRDGNLMATRPVYSGKALAEVRVEARPAIFTIRPNVFGQASVSSPPRELPVREVRPEPSPARVRSLELRAVVGELDVTEASTIVSGGRGMRGPENWPLLERLRDALGSEATLGASRAVVDVGWRPHAEQVGQTGKTVSPKLYFAVGISGAIQHLAGMRSSGTIVAINRDPDAPIFHVADYGIVGDAFEVLPALTEAVAKLRADD